MFGIFDQDQAPFAASMEFANVDFDAMAPVCVAHIYENGLGFGKLKSSGQINSG